MQFDNLTSEQLAKARACRSIEELLDLAMAEGVELTDEQLDAISGGSVWDWSCPVDVWVKKPSV